MPPEHPWIQGPWACRLCHLQPWAVQLPSEAACARPLVCVPPGLTSTDSQKWGLLYPFYRGAHQAAGA